MIRFEQLKGSSNATRFGTCRVCGKDSFECDNLIRIKFTNEEYGEATSVCLCADCAKHLLEQLQNEL